MSATSVPDKPRGRPSREYYDQLDEFTTGLKTVDRTLDFKMSARGWGYYLEGEGEITKSQIDYAEKKINDLRKQGDLPLDFTAQDKARTFECGGGTRGYSSVDDCTKSALDSLLTPEQYYDVPFWDTQDCYIQVLVEKVDLVELFRPVCEDYHIPIATAKGWSSLLQRGKLAANFHKRDRAGNSPVLLYCGDFDPPGARISDTLRSNLADLQDAKIPISGTRTIQGWTPHNVEINRIGLNRDYIDEHGLRWVENLETGSGKNLANPRHADHDKAYVQQWLNEVGERKVEANALLKNPEDARDWFRECVEEYLGSDPKTEYRKQRDAGVKEIKTRLSELGIAEPAADALSELGGDGE